MALHPQAIPADVRGIGEVYEHVLVAVEQDRNGEAVIGKAAVSNAGTEQVIPVPKTIDLGGPAAGLRHRLVAPERWLQGVGRLLADAVVSYCREAGYHYLALDATTEQQGVVAFYRALGFEDAGHTEFRDWAHLVPLTASARGTGTEGCKLITDR